MSNWLKCVFTAPQSLCPPQKGLGGKTKERRVIVLSFGTNLRSGFETAEILTWILEARKKPKERDPSSHISLELLQTTELTASHWYVTRLTSTLEFYQEMSRLKCKLLIS